MGEVMRDNVGGSNVALFRVLYKSLMSLRVIFVFVWKLPQDSYVCHTYSFLLVTIHEILKQED